MSKGKLRDEIADDGSPACVPAGNGILTGLGHRGRSRVRMVLLVGTAFDLFSLVEEHRLQEVVRREYSSRDLGFVPVIEMARDMGEASRMTARSRYDVVVLFKPYSGSELAKAAEAIKEAAPSAQVACILPLGSDLTKAKPPPSKDIDITLVWDEDPRVFVALLTLAEDRLMTISSPPTAPKRAAVLVLEDDLLAFTRLCSALNDTVWELTLGSMRDDLTHEERLERSDMRPMLLSAGTILGPGKHPWVRPACVIAPSVPRYDERLPSLVFGYKVPILSRDDLSDREDPLSAARMFVERTLGKHPPVIGRECDGGRLVIKDLRTLEIAIGSLPDNVLSDVIEGGELQGWLLGMGEVELSDLLDGMRGTVLSGPERDALASAVRNRRYRRSGVQMTAYDRTAGGRKDRFSRIGRGAMGGKARALHFMNRQLVEAFPGGEYENMAVKVPRTIVICSDMFELFLKENDLSYAELTNLPDERIVQTFLASSLPAMLLGDVRAIVEELEGPIVIRSSSLLEDALFQPFAGIYASVMLSNVQMGKDQRFDNLCTAIKYVYSSTYLSRARSYIRSTDNDPAAERMSVMVQEVVGRKRGDLFYPAFSGVARSYDYWPQGACSHDDGCVNMAIGLGKSIVDGGATYRFCPLHPRSRPISSCSERLSCSQRKFYALRLFSRVKRTDFNEDSQLVLLDVGEADPTVLELGCSTYSSENDRFHPGIGREGPLSVDLAPILEEDAFPLASLVRRVLEMGQRSLGSPVEIEFALEIDEGRPEFHLLQVRSMVRRGEDRSVGLDDHRKGSILECSKCLGNGKYRISDVIMVRDRELGDGPTQTIRKELSRLNAALSSEKRGYILIGPGRWGSCDPWLGVPVSWNDISGVKVMVEVPASERPIDPSQGSHFFQNITSLRLGYMMVSPDEDRRAGWDRLMNCCKVLKDGPVRHLRSVAPLIAVLDGFTGRGILAVPNEEDDGMGMGPRGSGKDAAGSKEGG